MLEKADHTQVFSPRETLLSYLMYDITILQVFVNSLYGGNGILQNPAGTLT